VRSLEEDREGSIWIGSWGDGLSRHDPGIQTCLRDVSDISQVLEDKNHDIWIATDNDGAFRFDEKAFHPINSQGGMLADDHVKRMIQDAQGGLWFGGINGMTRYDGNGLFSPVIVSRMVILPHKPNHAGFSRQDLV
jgi:ligand-binding sensor domain-containing protein